MRKCAISLSVIYYSQNHDTSRLSEYIQSKEREREREEKKKIIIMGGRHRILLEEICPKFHKTLIIIFIAIFNVPGLILGFSVLVE